MQDMKENPLLLLRRFTEHHEAVASVYTEAKNLLNSTPRVYMQDIDDAIKQLREVYNYYDAQGEDVPDFIAQFLAVLVDEQNLLVVFQK
jgi:hypothetical protein